MQLQDIDTVWIQNAFQKNSLLYKLHVMLQQMVRPRGLVHLSQHSFQNTVFSSVEQMIMFQSLVSTASLAPWLLCETIWYKNIRTFLQGRLFHYLSTPSLDDIFIS